ncbi:NACHT domain-containing protein [Megamonas hypermegale]|uniref:NACHT domain-containing protein n=1 Tax=Megamonas hypermegale TaxID=158847 RepID=UPI0026F256C0|nr:NACHT domain-containing protein [Megamonas hypermegale]
MIILDTLIKEGISIINKQFIVPKIKEWSINNKIDNCLINYDNVLSKYFERSVFKCSLLNTVVPDIEKKSLKTIYLPLTLKGFHSSNKNDIIILDKYDKESLEKYNNILILDNAGMGKSTLMKFLFLEVVEKHIGIPFFIELRTLSSEKSIIDCLYDEIEDIKDATPQEIKREFLKAIVDNGDCIFFFDGYDEMTPDNKPIITKKLQDFILKANKNKYFISSRYDDALISLYNNFDKFNIKPLSKDEAYQLLKKFDNNGKTSNNLINKLKENDNLKILYEFLNNPLTISLLYFNYKYEMTLPNTKYEFYNSVYKNLYKYHDLRKGGSFERIKYSSLNITYFEKVLRYIGFYSLLKLKKTLYTERELLSLIEDSKSYISKDFETVDYLHDLLETVPLFIKDGIQYSWVHKSFQEYFAAMFLSNLSNKKTLLPRIFQYDKIEMYSNLLDFYYEIDPEAFNDIIVKNFLDDFVNYMQSDIQDTDYLFIKSLLFSQNITLNYTNTKSFKSMSNHQPKIVEITYISANGSSYSKNVHSLYPHIGVKYQYRNTCPIQYFLQQKGFDLWKNIDFNQISDDLSDIDNAKMESLLDIHLNDYINDYNKIQSFVSFLIKVYIKLICSPVHRPLYLLDYDKCKKALDEINQKIAYKDTEFSWL